jgi:iron-sulfur cluster assembly protein
MQWAAMIYLSQAAIGEVKRIKSKSSNPEALFRLKVQSGGCADFYYTLTLDEGVASDDQVLNCNDVQVVVDAQSWPYVAGLNLDYSEDLMGGGFRFNNPNSVSNCGCGNSFSITAPSAQPTSPDTQSCI